MQLTTRHWKIFTSVMMVVCVGLFVSWPYFMGERPGASAPIEANKAYAVKFVIYLSVIVFSLILAAIGSVVILRRTAAEYRALQIENMKSLVEATLADQKRKNDSAQVD